jgi:serine/threonine-protein kinase
VVLRDLQSAHVFVTRKRNGEPTAKITDFGTCKVMRQGDTDQQSCTKLLGLSSSASPELVRQMRQIDERADIWSLGCMLYEMFAGVPAFVGDGTALMLSIANDEPVPASSLRRDIDIPPAIDRAILQALSKSRSERYQTVYQLASALAPFASARGQLLIAQVARLAGVEPAVPIAEASDDVATNFVQSVPQSAPAPYAAGAPYPLASPAFASGPASRPASVPPMSGALVSPFATALPANTALVANTAVPAHTAQLAHVAPPVSIAPPSPPPMSRVFSAAPHQTAAAHAQLATSFQGAPIHGTSLQATPLQSTSTEFDAFDPMLQPRRSLKKTLGLVSLALAPIAIGAAALFSYGAAEPVAHASWTTPQSTMVTARADVTPVADEVVDELPAEQGPSNETPGAATPTGGPTPYAARENSGSQFLNTFGAQRSEPSGAQPSKKEVAKSLAKEKATEPAGQGTIVAMAIGASCAFSIDGGGRGSSSSVRALVSAGRHSVSCQPVGGSRRTKSVMVEPGQAATAVFKF